MEISVTTSSIPTTPYIETAMEPNPNSVYNTQSGETKSGETKFPVPPENESFTEYIPKRDMFNQYVKAWHYERRFLSSLTEIENCPSHQDIVAMGQDAVKFIFEELTQSKPKLDFWFITLQKITNQNPVPKEYAGDLKKICAAWVQWWNTKNDE
jgi:hypothetical protein